MDRASTIVDLADAQRHRWLFPLVGESFFSAWGEKLLTPMEDASPDAKPCYPALERPD